LIYDDKCYSCTKFANTAKTLSNGWIRTAGHYHSEQAKIAKMMIFPDGYDSTKMFWLVNRSGAHGARCGLVPLVKEIVRGWFWQHGQFGANPRDDYNDKNNKIKNQKFIVKGKKDVAAYDDHFMTAAPGCEYREDESATMSCYTATNVFVRLFTMLSHGANFWFR
jgi:hypothetical protein